MSLSPIPLPWFSNSLLAYSRMSPYGAMVGTVATTTTSPLAALQRANHLLHRRGVRRVDDVREIVDGLRQFGEVGGWRLKRGGRHSPTEAGQDETPPAISASARTRPATVDRRLMPTSTTGVDGRLRSRRPPAVDVLHEPLHGFEVRGKDPRRLRRRDIRGVRELDHFRDDARRAVPAGARRSGPRRPGRASASPCSRATLVSSAANGAAERTIEHRRARCRCPRSRGSLRRRCSRWLRACTSHARRMSAGSISRPSNGSLPVTTTWSAMMAPNSSGKASSDCSNSPLDRRSGVARPASVPRADVLGAGPEIGRPHGGHDRQRRCEAAAAGAP